MLPGLKVQGAGQAPHQLQSRMGGVRRLLWADTPSLETMAPSLLLPLTPKTILNSVPTQLPRTSLLLTVLGAEAQPPHSHQLAPHFFEVTLARATLVFSHRILGAPSSLPALFSLHPFSAWSPNISPCPQPDLTSPIRGPDWLPNPLLIVPRFQHLSSMPKFPLFSQEMPSPKQEHFWCQP